MAARRLGHSARSARITAELAWFLLSPRRRHDPYPAYARLRRLDRVHRSPLGVWVLSGHAEVAAALRDPRLSSDERHLDPATLRIGPLRRLVARGGGAVEEGPYFERVRRLLLFADPPDHTRLRRLVSRAFTPRRVADLEPRIAALVAEHLDGLDPGSPVDLMAAVAYPVPARVVCELLGVPAAEAQHLVANAPALAAGLDPILTAPVADAANAATEAVVAVLERVIDQRRAAPGDDLLSALLAASDEEGDALGADELVDMLLLLLIAGHETTANLLGNGILALHAQPSALAELRADPSLDAAAVDELLRFDSSVQMTMRVAVEPVDLGPVRIDPGTAVICCLAAANRDEAVFAHPDRLDWHREVNPHVAFGGGIHHCLGAALARAEARIALRAVLDRYRDLEVVGSPVRRASFTIRGVEELRLVSRRAAPA